MDPIDWGSPILRLPDGLVTSTPLASLNRTITRNRCEENNEVEEIAGCNKMDVIVMKHTTKAFMDIIKRLLESDEFEVRKSDGTIISQGRVSDSGVGNGNTVANEEYQRIIKERDQARQEASKMHDNYVTLYDTFNATRETATDIRTAYEGAAEKLKTAAEEAEEWKAKFHVVCEKAEEELERASMEYDELMKNNEDGTKGLRLRVKRMDLELASKNEEIEVLKNRIVELSGICDQLMNDFDCDSSVHEA